MRSGIATLWRHQLLVLLAGTAVFFIGLGGARLWDEDETEYSRCAREMMSRGDWVVPTFNGQAWLEKPVLVYWLMIGSFRVFGPTEFAARLPSAVFAIGTALLTYHLGRRLFRPRVGLWAGLILATSLMFVIVARAATLDSTLVFFTTLSLFAYVVGMGNEFWHSTSVARGTIAADIDGALLAGQPDRRIARFRAVLPGSWWSFLSMYVPLGLAVMVKGPLGVLLPVAAFGMFVWISGAAARLPVFASPAPSGETPPLPPSMMQNGWRRLREMAADFPAATWAMRPLTLAAVVLVIAAPWYIWVSIRTHGDFWTVFIWQHNVQYILHSQQGHAGSTVYYYPLALVIGFFPWTLALALGAIGAIGRIRRHEKSRRSCILAITWSLTWYIVMSLVGTKLPHYLVPAYPMLAVMAGLWIADWIVVPQSIPADRWIAAGLGALGLLGIVVIIGLPIALRHWAPGQPSCSWLGMILAGGALVGWLFLRRRRIAATAATLVVTAGALYIGVFAIAGPGLSVQQSSVQMTDAIERLGAPSTPVGVYRVYLPGMIYYADRQQPIIGLKRPDEVRTLFDANGDFLIVTDLPGLIELRPHLPVDAVVLESQTRFLKGSELLVIGRRRAAVPRPQSVPPSAPATASSSPAGAKR